MSACLTLDGAFGNPASRSHSFGWDSDQLVKDARQNVADLIKCDSKEVFGRAEQLNRIIWPSKELHTSINRKVIILLL